MDAMRWRITVALAGVAAAMLLAACGGDTERVLGRLTDVQSSGLLVLDSIEIIDDDGRHWVLEGPGDFGHLTPSHLRQHMVLGERLEVTFHRVGHRSGGRLVIDRLRDYP